MAPDNVDGIPSIRKRWRVAVVLASVLLAGAITAGVLGSKAAAEQRRPSRLSPSSGNTVHSDNFLESLVGINEIPTLPIHQIGAADTTTTTMTDTVAVKAQTSSVPTSFSAAKAGNSPINSSTSANSAYSNPFEGALDSLKEAMTATTNAKKAPSPAPTGSVTTGGWRGIGGTRNTICYPRNGTEVVDMVDKKSPCTVIVLTRASNDPYTIRKVMNVTTTKIIIGNPISMPALNASKIERLFNVLPGGRLELRAVILYRGSGRKLEDGRLRVVIGGSAYVSLGGSFTATGSNNCMCVFREEDQTLQKFLDELPGMLTNRSRNFGGQILVVGGQLYLQGCTFLRVRQYGNAILNNAQVGRDVLLVAGNLVLSGCFNLNVNLFAQNVVVGNTLAVIGGTAVWAGGTTCNVSGVQAQWGAGVQMFVGGGVLVTAGFNYISVNGAVMRGSFGLFSVGGGVHIQTGYLQARAWGVGSINNAGQTFSVGGGIHQIVGGAIATSSIANVFNGAGGTTFVGSGQLRWIGMAQATTATAQSQYGVGLTFYNGAGTTNLIYSTQASAQVARAQFCLASDSFLGAGWHTAINVTRFAAQYVNAFFGEGNQIWVGAGGAAFIRCYTSTRRGYGYSTTKNLYTIAGTGVSRSQGQRNIVVTKAGQYRLPFQPSPKPKKTRRILEGSTAASEDEDSSSPVTEAVASLMSATVNLSSAQNAFFSPEGRSKLLVLQTYMEDRKQTIVEDPALFQTTELKDYWGGFAQILADGIVGGNRDKAGIKRVAPEISKGLISVNNTDCFLCNVQPGVTAEHVSGPGTCEVSDACQGDSPMETFQAAKASTDQDISFPGMMALPRKLQKDDSSDLPDVWLLWHEMTVYCRSVDPTVDSASITDGCLSPEYVKTVIRAYLGQDNQGEYQLAVASTGIHDSVKPLAGEELQQAMAPEWNPDCEGWTKYNVYITANDKDVEEQLLAEWRDIVNDPTDLEATLLQNADANAKVKPCSIALKRVGVANYPSFGNMKGFKPLSSGMSLAGPSITLASEKAITPISKIIEGETYKMYIQNFMKGAKINIHMVKGLDRTGPVIASISDFNDNDGDGITELAWTAPLGLKGKEQEGDVNKYYLLANVESFPALFANSQAFTIAP